MDLSFSDFLTDVRRHYGRTAVFYRPKEVHYEEDEEEWDEESMTLGERLERFMSQDAAQLEYFARQFRVAPDVLAGIGTIGDFFHFLVTALGNQEEVWGNAIQAILKFCKFDYIDTAYFIHPEVLPRIAAGLSTESLPIVLYSLRTMIRLIEKHPEALPPLHSLGLVSNMWNLMMMPECDPTLDNPMRFMKSIDDICWALDTIIAIPESCAIFAELWQIALMLVKADDMSGVAVQRGLYYLAKMLARGMESPVFDAEAVHAMVEAGSDSEKTLKSLFQMLVLLDDNGDLWRALVEGGIIPHLMGNIATCPDNSYIIYRFLGDVNFDPYMVPDFLKMAFHDVINGSFRLQREVIWYLVSIFLSIKEEDIKAAVEQGIIVAIADMLSESQEEDFKHCAELTGRILDVFINSGVRLSTVPGVDYLREQLNYMLDADSDEDENIMVLVSVIDAHM